MLGVGAAVTIAAWTDTEWVFGGTDTGAPIGSTSFEVQQNVYDGGDGAAQFVDRETQSGAGGLNFTVTAGSLPPGVTVYAPMQLRTTAGSIAGAVVLNAGVDGSEVPTALFAALTYHVKTGVAQTACNSVGMAGTAGDLVPVGSPLATAGTVPFAVPAGVAGAPGASVDLCFALTLPMDVPDGLQGLLATPVWSFTSTSVE